MARIISVFLSFFLGKFLAGGIKPSAYLLRISMLMLRKVLQLFMVSFGALLFGIVGLGIFLQDITSQLQVSGQVFFTPSMGVSLTVAVMSFLGCALVFRKPMWLESSDLQLQTQSATQAPDLLHSLANILKQVLDEKMNANQRPSPSVRADVAVTPPLATDTSKEMHYNYSDELRKNQTLN